MFLPRCCMEAAKVRPLDPTTPRVHEVDPATPEEAAPAVASIIGPDLFVGFDPGDLTASVTDFASGLVDNRAKALNRLPKLATDFFNILTARSEIEPDPADKRFSDPAWKENPLYRGLMQGYLAWRDAMLGLVNEQDSSSSDWKTPAQKRFAVSLLTEALAPT